MVSQNIPSPGGISPLSTPRAHVCAPGKRAFSPASVLGSGSVSRRGRIRGAGAQVSNLGAEPFRGAFRGGQGSCTQIAGGNQRLRSTRRKGMNGGGGEAGLRAGGP